MNNLKLYNLKVRNDLKRVNKAELSKFMRGGVGVFLKDFFETIGDTAATDAMIKNQFFQGINDSLFGSGDSGSGSSFTDPGNYSVNASAILALFSF